MGMNMFMNSLYNNPRSRRDSNNSNPFGIDRSSNLAGHFQNHAQSAQSAPTMQQMENQRMQQDMQKQKQNQRMQLRQNGQRVMNREESYQQQSGQNMRQQVQGSQSDQQLNQGSKQQPSNQVNRSDSGVSFKSATNQNAGISFDVKNFSTNDLKNAIVLNEIISSPVSKRQKRRGFGRR